MGSMTRPLGAICVGVLAVATIGGAAAGAERSTTTSSTTRTTTGGQPATVTLITGDRVTLTGPDHADVAIAPADHRRSFQQYSVDGHVYVIPSNVRSQVARGVLDRRLFDITGLIEARYDDEHADTIPLIVSNAPGARPEQRIEAAGADAGKRQPLVAATPAKLPKKEAAGFVKELRPGAKGSGIERVWLDGRRRVDLAESVPQIGAPAAWEAGYTGEGTTIAVLDTGIDAAHADLAGQVAATQDFSGEGTGDGSGHGTHVASTIAGTGAASGGTYKGVAPDASLLDGKVCDSGGWCEESAILAGMEWAAAAKDADVVNLSLGGPDSPEIDPLEEAVNTLTASTGALFVIAAGNDGPNTIGSPASAERSLAVGAVTKSDALAEFSSTGPTADGGIKPDVTAPGVDIVAAKAAGAQIGEPVGEDYLRLSGTSMATPHVAGAAALLAQQHAGWDADEIKAALAGSATPNPTLTPFQQGSGRIDLAKAIKQSIVSEPSSLGFGVTSYPHEDDPAITKELTYRNLGSTPVTLSLATVLNAPDGSPAPEGTLTLSASEVTVPAGGTASVTATVDTSYAGGDGVLSGTVTATSAEAGVVTPVGVEKEVESYDLTLKSIGSDGKGAALDAAVFGLDHEVFEFPFSEEGSATLRLPVGDYNLSAFVGNTTGAAHLVQPVLTLDEDTVWTADARKAKPVSVTVPDRKVSPALVSLGYFVTGDAGNLDATVWVPSFDGLSAGQVGPKVSGKTFTASLGTDWTRLRKDGMPSPTATDIYKTFDVRPGAYWNGYRRAHRAADFAVVKQRFNASGTLPETYTNTFARFGEGGSSAAGLPLNLPMTRTLHTVAPKGTTWSTELWQEAFEEGEDGEETWTYEYVADPWSGLTYKPGRRYIERWNAAVFGPNLAVGNRVGNDLFLGASLLGDSGRHSGSSSFDSGNSVLYRNGKEVLRSVDPGFVEAYELPAGKATFRFATSLDRSGYSKLSTKVSGVWTFTSGRTDPEKGAAVPMWAATLRPVVNARNVGTERKGWVPLVIQSTGKVGKLKTVAVKVSYDSGKTWKNARVKRDGRSYLAAVVAPKRAKTVSFQVSLADNKGNTTKETIIRAYPLK